MKPSEVIYGIYDSREEDVEVYMSLVELAALSDGIAEDLLQYSDPSVIDKRRVDIWQTSVDKAQAKLRVWRENRA